MLNNRIAIITGAGQGIGRAYALAFARKKATVIVADINKSQASHVANEIQAVDGAAIAIEVDVSDKKSVKNMVRYVSDKYGHIDILINNAAVFSSLSMKPFEEITLDEWDKVLDVNAKGTFLCCQEVAPIMRKNNYGRIVNISSSVVMTGRANYAHYVASKGAVYALTHALATELGPNDITVNAISPHGIVTEVERETITDKQWDAILDQQALKRKGEVDDIVEATLFLASEGSKYITGQTLGVDAGLRYT